MYFEKVSRAIFYEERKKEREGRSDKTAVHTSDNRAALYQDEREIAALIKRKYLVTISFPRASTSTTNLMSKSTSAV